jgi:hypothetical protein
LKKYLLKTLPAQEAEAIEERYFTDAALFRDLRTAEIELICEYLDGELDERERKQFDIHYLQVPALFRLVENVRVAKRSRVRRATKPGLLKLALAVTVAGVVIGALIFRATHTRTTLESAQMAPITSTSASINLVLTPRLTKGPQSSMPILDLPDAAKPIILAVQMPGNVSLAPYAARLLNVDVEVSHKEVWAANGLSSKPLPGGREIIVEIPSAAIAPGDYILEMDSSDGRTVESYVLRAVGGERRQ